MATFLLATLCWTLFRSQNLNLLAQLWQKMFSFGQPLCITNGSVIALIIIITGIIVQLFGERLKLDYNWLKQPIPIKGLAYAMATVAIIIGNSEGAKPFIYFQF
jgi:hypothetical protein